MQETSLIFFFFFSLNIFCSKTKKISVEEGGNIKIIIPIQHEGKHLSDTPNRGYSIYQVIHESSNRNKEVEVKDMIENLDFNELFPEISADRKKYIKKTCKYIMETYDSDDLLALFIAYVKLSTGDSLKWIESNQENWPVNYSGRGIIKITGEENYKEVDKCLKSISGYDINKNISFEKDPNELGKATLEAFIASGKFFAKKISTNASLEKMINTFKPMSMDYESFKNTKEFKKLKKDFKNAKNCINKAIEDNE